MPSWLRLLVARGGFFQSYVRASTWEGVGFPRVVGGHSPPIISDCTWWDGATFSRVVTWRANILHFINLGLNFGTTFGCFGFCVYLAFNV